METEFNTSHGEPRIHEDILDLGRKIDHSDLDEHAPIYEALVDELKIELESDGD